MMFVALKIREIQSHSFIYYFTFVYNHSYRSLDSKFTDSKCLILYFFTETFPRGNCK